MRDNEDEYNGPERRAVDYTRAIHELAEALGRISQSPPAPKGYTIALSILGAGFMAWAGIVWQAVGSLNEVVVEIRHLRDDFTDLAQGFEQHAKQPWHDRAGFEIERLRERAATRENTDELRGSRRTE